ncbi:MAG TPA: plastocyanin/azurin family copper-binding protein [Phycisphaerae bacterium]|nr:plastocyanin/azurin family copper-binding protein [Phycisphaerae bacterium]
MTGRVLLKLFLMAFVPAFSISAGCPGTSPGGDVENLVTIENFIYTPSPLTIERGQAVRWINLDISVHTVTSGHPGDPDAGSLFDSGAMHRNDTFEHTFNQTGTFVYFCRPHSQTMRDAVVIVQ